MGSGKSTVGKIISSELFLNFFDTDEEIENRTGASIDWIFALQELTFLLCEHSHEILPPLNSFCFTNT